MLATFAGVLPAGDAAVGGNGINANMLEIIHMTFVAAQVSTTTRMASQWAQRMPSTFQSAFRWASTFSVRSTRRT